jgi:hypothetical protein
MKFELVKCRDSGMNSYTYFWRINGQTISPFFETETEAQSWLRLHYPL